MQSLKTNNVEILHNKQNLEIGNINIFHGVFINAQSSTIEKLSLGQMSIVNQLTIDLFEEFGRLACGF